MGKPNTLRDLQVYGADKVWKQMNREGLPIARWTGSISGSTAERLNQLWVSDFNGAASPHVLRDTLAKAESAGRCRVLRLLGLGGAGPASSLFIRHFLPWNSLSPRRALVVDAVGARLTALGTRFAVRNDAQGGQLAVFEGNAIEQSSDSGFDVLFSQQENKNNSR